MLRAQQGLALITALLVVAIVATIATYLSLGQQVWLRQAQNLVDRSQADSMRHAALDWVGILLTREAKDSKTDHLNETWAKALPPLPYEGGTIQAVIGDAQGLFNLNNLVRAGTPSVPDVGMFRQLLQQQGLDPALADAVVDWIDPDTQTRPGGAEDVEYLSGTRPYRAANQLLASVDELRLIRGFTPAAVEKLRPYLSALPEATPLNVNTAPEAVLAALFPDMVPGMVQPILRAREQKPFDDPADVTTLLPPSQKPPQAQYGFSTGYFLVRLDVGYGRWTRSTVAMIHRPGGGKVTRVLWHHPLYPKLPRDGEESENKT
jgi:general secretion pathway protein K